MGGVKVQHLVGEDIVKPVSGVLYGETVCAQQLYRGDVLRCEGAQHRTALALATL